MTCMFIVRADMKLKHPNNGSRHNGGNETSESKSKSAEDSAGTYCRGLNN